jgi:hypothetical protein
MKSYTILTILIIALIISAQAQENIQVSGRVTDATNGEGLQFVNVGIEGTLIGTASEKTGIFRFTVPAGLPDSRIFFSAIGYEQLSIPLQSFLKQPGLVALQPQTYGIDDVEIQTKSKVPYRIIRDAVQNIPSKFIHQACNFTAYYESQISGGTEQTKFRKAKVLIADPTGYDAQLNTDAKRNYRFLNVHRNFEVQSLSDGTTLMDELLLADAAAYRANVLNLAYLHEYELEVLKNSTEYGDSVWVIAFKHPSPDISRTGHFHASGYEGKVFVDRTDMVPLRIEMQYTAGTHSSYGAMAVAQPDEDTKQITKILSISYKKTPHGYAPNEMILIQTALNQWKKTIRTEASLNIVEINTEAPEHLSERQYFEKMHSDPVLTIPGK